jgi:alpha-1,2-mannosyltransferase
MSGPNPAEGSLRDVFRQHRTLLVTMAIAEVIALIMVSAISPHDHIDGEVYQLGAKAWLAGRDIYDNLPTTESGLNLPFIYPPFAAIVFSPLALLPKKAAIAAIMLVTHVALLITLYVILRTSTFMTAHRNKVILVTAGLLPLATITEPVMETITYAQINIVLMAAVALDCLWRVDGDRKLPYPRGLLIGLAAGVKLTPAVFLLFLVLRKDFRTILTALAAFAGTVLIGLVLAFDDAKQFWLREMMATGNVSFGPKFTGDATIYAGNQSVRSLLTKLQVPAPTAVFVVLAVIVLAIALVGMVHAIRERDLPLAVTINGILGVLVSPISWSHHWVWAIPALLLLGGKALTQRNWPLLMISSLAAAFFTLGPHWKVPQGKGKELHWNVLEHLVGNAYVYFGLAFLIYAAYLGWRSYRSSRELSTEPAPSPSPAAPVG